MVETKRVRVERHLNDGHYGEPPARTRTRGYGILVVGLAMMAASVVAYVGMR